MSGFVVLGMFIYVLTLISLLFIPCVFKNDLRWCVVKPQMKTPFFLNNCSITTSKMYFGT